MHLAPTEDQRQIVDATRDVLTAEAPFARWFVDTIDPAADDARLSALGAAMGWLGFTAPSAIGGAGASPVDEMLVFRELGARLVPVGIGAAAIAVQVALALGRERLASAIVAGTERVGLAVGTGHRVLIGAPSAYALRAEGDELTIVDASAAMPADKAIDWITAAATLPDAPAIARLTDASLARRHMLLIAAQAQGIAETALAQANAYAKEREQFGRAIGSFQAIRHRIADMEIRARRAEMQLRFAAVRNADQGDDARLHCLAATLLALEAARENAEANIFIHGAMGVTTENIGHLLLKRALLWQLVLGPESALLDAIGECDAPTL